MSCLLVACLGLACPSPPETGSEGRERATLAFAEARIEVARAIASFHALPPGPDTRVEREELSSDVEQLQVELVRVAGWLSEGRWPQAVEGAERVTAEAKAIVSDVERAAAARSGSRTSEVL